MAETRRIVKVFLASPGDLRDERRAAKSVVDEYNALTADEFGYQVELVGWEDTVSVYGRPQATINRDLERCELFVGLMWKKWGTPPDKSGTYSSGFEEEFETSVKRRVSKGGPEISLFFKDIEPEFLADPGEDLKKVLAFKKRLIAEKELLFETFAANQDFEPKLRRCIWNYVRKRRARDLEEASSGNQAPTARGEKQQTAETASARPKTPLSAEGVQFLREFIAKTERGSAENEHIAAVEIARFRLLASLVKRQGNDERSLGVHDANLLFSQRGRFTFGDRELAGLVATGLQRYADENTPLWHWVAETNGFTDQQLPFHSIVGTDTKRHTGALTAMRLIAESLPSTNRNTFLDSWFAKESPSSVRVAALAYLGDFGIHSDVAIIRKELDRGDNQTVSAAAEAIIRINFRDSQEKGIAALYEFQPTSISRKILEQLFNNESALSTEMLTRGLAHGNNEVRRIVAKLLRARHALTNEMAEQLTNDSDATVRYEALMSLVEAGRTYSDADAKRILVGQTRRGTVGLFGSLGWPDSTGERLFEQFREQRLRLLKDKELEEAAAEDPILNQTPDLTLIERHFDLRGEELRRKIDDQYKATFSRTLNTMIQKYGNAGAELVEKMRSLENSIRKRFTREALDIICRKAAPSDLKRMRSTLRSGFVDYSSADVEFLRKFGEWEDIPLIIEAVKRPEAGQAAATTLLTGSNDLLKYRAAARAIYTLGRSRLPELLATLKHDQVLVNLIAECTDKDFRGLSAASINLLLHSEADHVRKIAALKCIRALAKGRVAKLLASYGSSDRSRYYNVVHWLDFGVSTPRARALPGVERILEEEFRS